MKALTCLFVLIYELKISTAPSILRLSPCLSNIMKYPKINSSALFKHLFNWDLSDFQKEVALDQYKDLKQKLRSMTCKAARNSWTG